MNELNRLDDFSDSIDEPFGNPVRGPRPRRARASQRLHSQSDKTVASLRATSILASALGAALILSTFWFVAFRHTFFPGVVLIAVGIVAGHIARRARPARVTVAQLIWRVCPTVGCVTAGGYVVISWETYSSDVLPEMFSTMLLALSGIGTLAGILCGLGAWLFAAVQARAARGPVRRSSAVGVVAAGSVVGGVAAYLLLNLYRQTSPWALILVLVVTLAVATAVAIRLRVPRSVSEAPAESSTIA